MIPPLIAFITFNRLGLTATNLKALLDINEDFELYIIDSNSTDGTQEYIESLVDPRIKLKKYFDVNRGTIYPINYGMSCRKPGQYFMHIENDVHIHSNNFVSKFLDTMNNFPDLGILGAIRQDRFDQAINTKTLTNESYMYKNNSRYAKLSLFVGCFYCYRPELLDRIGYFNEENIFGDAEICHRVNKYTKWHTGVLLPSDLSITQEQSRGCENCLLKDTCSLSMNRQKNCMSIYSSRRKVNGYLPIGRKKLNNYNEALRLKQRDVYCASIHDPESMKNHYYDKESALENFNYYIENSN